MSTETPPSSAPIPFTKTLFLAVGTLGFTIGLFTGLSESPVAGAVISGFLTIITGGGAAALLAKKEPIHYTAEIVRGVAIGIIVLCVTSIGGATVGICFRTGVFGFFQQEEEELVTMSSSSYRITQQQRVKLVLLQKALDKEGIKPSENNALVRSIIESLISGDPKALNADTLKPIKRYLDESSSAIATLSEWSAGDYEVRRILSALKDRPDLLKEIQKEHAKQAGKDAKLDIKAIGKYEKQIEKRETWRSKLQRQFNQDEEDARRALFQAQQPELDVILTAITTYRGLKSPTTQDKARISVAH